jgi:UDP-N-acetylmuramate--alanine ligase
VAEVDESDKSQRRYFPLHSVITNMEVEHLDHYRDFEDIKACFRSYGSQTRPEGFLVLNDDDEALMEIFKDYPHSRATYGFQHRADFWAQDIQLFPDSSQYRLFLHDQNLGTVRLRIPGLHNISNSLAAFALLISMGLDPEGLIQRISDFRGTGRRLEVKLETPRLLVVDDYAHHPTEIQASLRALKNYGRRLTVIFQPHRFSRIKGLLQEFGNAFKDADRLILTDIYGAGEKDDKKISAHEVLETVKLSGHKNASFLKQEEILKTLKPTDIPEGELFAFLGAGDIGEIANAFAIRFKS